MAEISGMTLLSIWLLVILFHKHRFIIARRYSTTATNLPTKFLLFCGTISLHFIRLL